MRARDRDTKWERITLEARNKFVIFNYIKMSELTKCVTILANYKKVTLRVVEGGFFA